MKRNILIIMVFSLLGITYSDTTKGQSSQQNLDKYWHYRYRLINEFLSVGAHTGQSLPATSRNGNQTSGINDHILWIDACGRDLGWYIATLATEYRLLKNNGQPVNETIKELYYALHAVWRLDSTAITDWQLSGVPLAGWASSPLVWPGDGFMLTDDVQDGILSQLGKGDININVNPYGGGAAIGVGTVGPVNYVNSDFRGYTFGPGNPPYNIGSSPDNYLQLLMGLALVVKLVDPFITQFTEGTITQTIPYTNPVLPYVLTLNRKTDIVSMAYYEGAAILEYIINSSNYCLEYPDGTQILNKNAASVYAFPLQEAGVFFGTNGSWYNPSPATCNGVYYPSLWNDVYSLCAAEISDFGGTKIQNFEEGVVAATISNDGGYYGGSGSGWNMISALGNFSNSALLELECAGEPDLFALPSNQTGWDQAYGSVLELLYPGSISIGDFGKISLCGMGEICDSAPSTGPFSHVSLLDNSKSTNSNADFAPGGWASARRFMFTPDNDNDGDFNNAGNYNGLDYMLFFNLYNLMSEESSPPPAITGDQGSWPLSKGTGSVPFPYTISNCGPIVVTNLTVYPSGVRYIYAGDVNIYGGVYGIDFKPSGTDEIHIWNGAFFDASCPNFCCTADFPGYDYQADPGENNDHSARKPPKDTNKISVYKYSGEFDTAFANGGIMNYPNPFTSQTTIEFSLNKSGPIYIYINGVNGARIATLVAGVIYTAGTHNITYDASRLVSGTYLCNLVTGGSKKTIRIVKVKL